MHAEYKRYKHMKEFFRSHSASLLSFSASYSSMQVEKESVGGHRFSVGPGE